jgi:hypothetical protein
VVFQELRKLSVLPLVSDASSKLALPVKVEWSALSAQKSKWPDNVDPAIGEFNQGWLVS